MGEMQTIGFGIEWHFLYELIETRVPLDQEAVECHTWPFLYWRVHACMYGCMRVCVCVCMHAHMLCVPVWKWEEEEYKEEEV